MRITAYSINYSSLAGYTISIIIVKYSSSTGGRTPIYRTKIVTLTKEDLIIKIAIINKRNILIKVVKIGPWLLRR